MLLKMYSQDVDMQACVTSSLPRVYRHVIHSNLRLKPSIIIIILMAGGVV